MYKYCVVPYIFKFCLLLCYPHLQQGIPATATAAVPLPLIAFGEKKILQISLQSLRLVHLCVSYGMKFSSVQSFSKRKMYKTNGIRWKMECKQNKIYIINK